MEALFKDPFRCLVDDLLRDFRSLDELLLQLDAIRRKKEASENRNWKRMVARITGKDTLVLHTNPEPYQAEGASRKKLAQLDAYFRDLQRRYAWALAQIQVFEDQTTKIPRRIAIDQHLGLNVFDRTKRGSERKSVTKRGRPKEETSAGKTSAHAKCFQDEAEEADAKMHVVALLKELEERDEAIRMLNAQLQIKQHEVTSMMDVIQRHGISLLQDS